MVLVLEGFFNQKSLMLEFINKDEKFIRLYDDEKVPPQGLNIMQVSNKVIVARGGKDTEYGYQMSLLESDLARFVGRENLIITDRKLHLIPTYSHCGIRNCTNQVSEEAYPIILSLLQK